MQSDALVEEYVDGREIYVGVLGNSKLVTLPPWEMDFGTLPSAQARIATRKVKWDRKYQAKHGIETGKARDLSAAQRERFGDLAKRTYRALYMSGFARMDFRLRSDGRIVLLEANPNPNLSKGEDLADSAKAAGMSYTALVERIVQLGLAYMPEWRMFEPRSASASGGIRPLRLLHGVLERVIADAGRLLVRPGSRHRVLDHPGDTGNVGGRQEIHVQHGAFHLFHLDAAAIREVTPQHLLPGAPEFVSLATHDMHVHRHRTVPVHPGAAQVAP